MIRLIFTLLYAVIYLIFSLFAYLFVWIVGHFDMEKKNRLSLAIAQIFSKVLCFSPVYMSMSSERNIFPLITLYYLLAIIVVSLTLL